MRFSSALSVGLAILVRLQAFGQASQALPPGSDEAFDVTLIKDEETLAIERIRTEAARFLEAGNYRGLDVMARQLQETGKVFSRGYWEIAYFFSEVAYMPKEATHEQWEAHVLQMRNWFEQDPDSGFARIAMARMLLDYAWHARGTGWAHTVTDEGWRLMDERLTEARRILLAAESLAHTCPAFYSTRLKIAQVDGTPRDQYDQIFEEAVKAFPNFFQFYAIRAYYLTPRWHGTLGEWESLATEAADRLGGEDGDVLYARIVWEMHDLRLYGNILKEAAVTWPRAQRGFEALCRRYPNSISAPSEYCSISGFAPTGARKLMRSLFVPLRNRVDLSIWDSIDKFVRDYRWANSQ
jgi:hypothetical protein